MSVVQAEALSLAAGREQTLEETLKFHLFNRAMEAADDWVTEVLRPDSMVLCTHAVAAQQMTTAASRDIGKDQEDCEFQQKRFGDFEEKVRAGEKDNITSVTYSRTHVPLIESGSCGCSGPLERRTPGERAHSLSPDRVAGHITRLLSISLISAIGYVGRVGKLDGGPP